MVFGSGRHSVRRLRATRMSDVVAATEAEAEIADRAGTAFSELAIASSTTWSATIWGMFSDVALSCSAFFKAS